MLGVLGLRVAGLKTDVEVGAMSKHTESRKLYFLLLVAVL